MTERTKPADTTEENDESGKDGAQQIVDFGSALTKTPHGSVYCMTIIGQIEGHNTAASGAKTTKYEHVLPLLAKLPIDSALASACDNGGVEDYQPNPMAGVAEVLERL